MQLSYMIQNNVLIIQLLDFEDGDDTIPFVESEIHIPLSELIPKASVKETD